MPRKRKHPTWKDLDSFVKRLGPEVCYKHITELSEDPKYKRLHSLTLYGKGRKIIFKADGVLHLQQFIDAYVDHFASKA